ncbi:CRC domain-containing protein [Plasmodiophora brassicae]|uniref:CRC domain-containing protein n=1 Tax=Plasmodiophora brassicae TaxID=37360 RepID=A0A0G4J8L2_PLABS|nr:hypothetical protein PBRA_003282 [Plasmodiophora brassicae]SPQ99637.1 unnamed protein product [Plasmodiophora brassicae]
MAATFFSHVSRSGVMTLSNRLPDQPSFLEDDDDVGGRGEMPGKECRNCNCKNSRCLKLYCDCFAASSYCSGCNCTNCLNTPEHEQARQFAITMIRQRNPEAFTVRSSRSRSGVGCRCKKSGCTKKYCECFQNGLPCTPLCQCTDCQNPIDPATLQQKGSKREPSATGSAKVGRVPKEPDLTKVDVEVVNVAELMVREAQRLSDQEAAQDLLMLVNSSEPSGPSHVMDVDPEYGQKSTSEDCAPPPSPETAALLCDEPSDGVPATAESSGLLRAQHGAILTLVEGYLRKLVQGHV